MKSRLIATAIAVAFPALSHGQVAELLAAPLNSYEQLYNRVQKQVGADLAQARGYTGKGAVVAILDTGFEGSHPELKTQFASTQMFDASTGKYVAITDGNGHGTHVAGIVAGSTGTGYSYGIAPDARVLPIKVFTSSTWTASSTALAAGLKNATANNSVSVISMSLGGSGPLGGTFETALRNTVNADKLVVVAAGNSAGTDPQWPARYAKESWAKGQIVAVGAVDANNQIASFSNRAGDTANWYLVAPGTSVLSSYRGGSYAYMSGTSMATPVVAGAAALLEAAWPQLKAGQVAAILFQTATDLGAPGVDAIYGRGLLNVDRAMQPVGTLSVPTSGTKTVSTSATVLRTSAASWSGLRAAAAAGQFRGVSVDAFNRDFAVDYGAGIRAPARDGMAALLATAGRPLWVNEQVARDGSRFLSAVEVERPHGSFAGEDEQRTLVATSALFKLAGGKELALAGGSLAGRYFGLAELDGTLANPYLGLTRSAAQLAFGLSRGAWQVKAGVLDGGLNAAMAGQHGPAERASGGRALVGELNYAVDDAAMVGAQLADVAEADGWLGASGSAGLGLSSARTRTLTAHGSYRLSDAVTLAAQYSIARTSDARGDALLAAARGVRSEAFALGLVGHGNFLVGDRLSLTLSSPMRISRGTAKVEMPVDITAAGDPVFESRRVPLASTSRELKLALDYAMPLSATTSLSWVAALRDNADHVAGERDVQAGMVYRAAF
ncbi:S8 family peptidase [Thauera sp. 2A1]|uniref:S8 family peptidase n=1 Tax=Thauera sp. 2A1 TaxID=2570191 RepID=UPI00188492D8|nr:S8 family peptidase [Thauera sp. 2A1]KAI5912986.1 S8 family serine peptidase [Thauera sp. 2A1]